MVNTPPVDEPDTQGHALRNTDIPAASSSSNSRRPSLRPRFWQPDPQPEQDDLAADAEDGALELSPETAQHELDKLVSQIPNVIGRFVEWHKRHDPTLTALDVADVEAILTELARSPDQINCNHQTWKRCNKAVRKIAWWKGQDAKTWEEAYRLHGKMPFLPTYNALLALRYLDVGDEHIPPHFERAFATVDLGFHVFDGKPPVFWKGAKLDDPHWRLEYMKSSSVGKPPRINIKRLMGLMTLVMSSGHDNHNDDDFPVKDASDDEDLSSHISIADDNPMDDWPEDLSGARSSLTGDDLPRTRNNKRRTTSHHDDRPKRQKTVEQEQDLAAEPQRNNEEVETSKQAWVDELTMAINDALCKAAAAAVRTYSKHVQEHVTMMVDRQHSIVDGLGAVMGRRMDRFEEELSELRARVGLSNARSNEDDSERSGWEDQEL